MNPAGDGYVVDGHGIARGGIRTPWVDVPLATLTGLAPAGGPGFAFLFGHSQLFDSATVAALYPGGKDDYLGRFDQALERAVGLGFLLEADTAEIKALASASFPSDD